MKKFIFILAALIFLLISMTAYPQKIFIISDIDDTIKITGLKAGTMKMVEHGSRSQAFFAIDLVYQLFYENGKGSNGTVGREIFFVSGAPGQLGKLSVHFLKKNEFPFPSKAYFLNKKIGEKTLDAKLNAITPIIEAHPNSTFILIGDNGEFDPDVYKTLQDKYGSRLIVFIHYVYAAANLNIVNYSSSNTRQSFEIFQGQTPYFTGVDLAIQFYRLGLISKENVLRVVNESLQNIDPIFYNNIKNESNYTPEYSNNHSLRHNQKLFYQEWMTGCKGFMTSEWNNLVTPFVQEDLELSSKIERIRSIITQFRGCEVATP
ncbi:DUF2183 domain-containing protein [Pigmentibacter sp. JX0631]|uniref:phosphatase domain-containing protein n=1 Tax=Pigmentibacter sp. JX0631 TaxID=2976982 RepID=UPI0024692534|nr:phosphatase domain-containing protein [Pigmentibacter sp. JX0631]WGL58731.1 DUF2183 domain-containing protein [Pigmentibacter sp. JX0631]